MKDDPRAKKHAVVMAGGSSHGAYHVGAIKALMRGESPTTNGTRLDPQVFAGTSAGAFNAAALLGQIEADDPAPHEHLERAWLDRLARTGTSCGSGVFRVRANASRFLNVGCMLRNPLGPFRDMMEDASMLSHEAAVRGKHFFASTTPMVDRVLDQLNLSTFISLEPLRRVIEDMIRFDLIAKSERHIRLAAVNWATGKVRYFRGDEMTVDVGPKIVQASAALPGIFPRVDVQGESYGDGGVVENTPLTGAVRAGADVVHVITSIPLVADIPIGTIANSLETFYRLLIINTTETLNRNIESTRRINQEIDRQSDEGTARARHEDSSAAAAETAAIVLDRGSDKRPLHKVEIHIYNPAESLGGLLSLLNFNREYLDDLIKKGYHDTVRHNCVANQCVLLT